MLHRRLKVVHLRLATVVAEVVRTVDGLEHTLRRVEQHVHLIAGGFEFNLKGFDGCGHWVLAFHDALASFTARRTA